MSYVPYIHFKGNCRAAMTCYHNIFGGVLNMMTWAEAPDASPEMLASDRIMHSTLNTGGHLLMAGDFPPGMDGDKQKAFSISHFAPSVDEAKRIFDALADSGTVISDFAATFWSDGFGMLTDRFGTHWMIAGPERDLRRD